MLPTIVWDIRRHSPWWVCESDTGHQGVKGAPKGVSQSGWHGRSYGGRG